MYYHFHDLSICLRTVLERLVFLKHIVWVETGVSIKLSDSIVLKSDFDISVKHDADNTTNFEWVAWRKYKSIDQKSIFTLFDTKTDTYP